jgi:hypothetical protein
MKRGIAIFFASLMLMVSIGAAFNTHYCGGKAVRNSLALGTDINLDCGMAAKAPVHKYPCDGEHYSEKSCCENQMFLIKIKNNYKSISFSYSIFKIQFPVFHVFKNTEDQISEVIKTTTFQNYSAPPLIQESRVMLSTFLI